MGYFRRLHFWPDYNLAGAAVAAAAAAAFGDAVTAAVAAVADGAAVQ